MSTNSLSNIITVDKEKCVNCHTCIGKCPVKYCNDASDESNGIIVNPDLCITCGACIKVCSHDARSYLDDTSKFLDDLNNGENIAVLIAPAVDVNFPDKINNIIGWLKSLGVKKAFDVSFGAEITTQQYVNAYKSGVNNPIIAQPCPCVVSYIEIYKPKLLKYLAPTGSPVHDMAAFVKSNHKDLKLAFISPCIAKKREFEDPNTKGLITYNVTISQLKKHLEENKIDLAKFEKCSFDGPIEAERGVLYSQPGGLYETFKRYNVPLKSNQVRRVEGIDIYEEFFEELEKDIESGICQVAIVDVLNCTHGCNRGTGTIYNERTTDEALSLQEKRLNKHKEEYYQNKENIIKLEDILSKMQDIDFSRKYNDKSEKYLSLQEPTSEVKDVINEQMGKFNKQDFKNCGACGYGSCENMTKAILNGLYRPEQCHHFLENFYKNSIKSET